MLCKIVLLSVLGVVITHAHADDSDELSDHCDLIIIAHRGASGYIPEHTLGAYALAITMGADYVEPDLVMSKDRHLIARHENEISLTTNVKDHPEFASRFRSQIIDGTSHAGWFTEDFTLEELKTLRAIERIPVNRPGNARMDNSFEIVTFQEIIDLVKAMQASRKRTIGIYPEIKHSTHFQRINLTMEKPLIDILHANGYSGADSPIIIQSFEVTNLKELKNLASFRSIQLFSSNPALPPYDQFVSGSTLTYGQMATAEGLKEVAQYAYGVGPDKGYIIPRDAQNKLGEVTTFVRDAHAAGLKVHPYTFRAEDPFLPADFQSTSYTDFTIGNFSGELEVFINTGIDGLFADQPDVPAMIRGQCTSSAATTMTFNMLILSVTLLILISLTSSYIL